MPNGDLNLPCGTGLRSWIWEQDGISIQLIQRLPDQTRAFFIGRGFSTRNANLISQACVFQSIFRNDGTQPIHYDLDQWSIQPAGKTPDALPLQTRERWEKIWRTNKTNPAALIAFRWSLLPTRQAFEPGDYNWGMISFGLPPGKTFDLPLSLSVNGKMVTGSIPAIVCRADPS